MTTLREHLEAIRDRHREFVDDSAWHKTIVWCHACDEVKFPCPDREDAVAALALLDAAERAPFDNTHPDYCCLLDPEPVASRNAP